MIVSDLNISLYKLHANQQKVKESTARFRTLNCGRRFGKTTYGKNQLIEPAIEGFPTAWYAPTYKDQHQVWRQVNGMLRGFIKSKNEQLKELILYSGGNIDFWTLDNPDNGRGRPYKRVVIDEVAKSKKFEQALEETIMPTLTDFGGDIDLLSTPKGRNSYWYDICHKDDPNWETFNFTSYDNPFILDSEIDRFKSTMHPKKFAQEFLAQFVDFSAESFFYEFEGVRGKLIRKGLVIDPMYPVWISFDFNKRPCTAIISQKLPTGCYFYKVHQVNGGTRALCQRLKEYVNTVDKNRLVYVCGDNSGRRMTSAANRTDYQIIQSELNLTQFQFKNNTKANHHLDYSREVCNHFIHNVPFFIDSDCDGLIYDLDTASVDDREKVVKDRKNNKQDVGDAFRYQIHSWFPNMAEILVYARNCKMAA